MDPLQWNDTELKFHTYSYFGPCIRTLGPFFDFPGGVFAPVSNQATRFVRSSQFAIYWTVIADAVRVLIKNVDFLLWNIRRWPSAVWGHKYFIRGLNRGSWTRTFWEYERWVRCVWFAFMFSFECCEGCSLFVGGRIFWGFFL